MTDASSIGGTNIESLINNVAADFGQSDIEDKKISKSHIKVTRNKIKDQRKERIQNLTDQLKGPAKSGGCFKVLKVVFKVVDFLMKPLSALTMNQLKTNLSKTLDMLKDTKNQKRLLGLNIKEQDILKVMENLKKKLGDDTEHIKTQESQMAKDTQTILKIIEDISSTYKSIQTKV